MSIKKQPSLARTRKLSFVILEYLLLSALVALFTFLFLYSMSSSIGESYLLRREITISEIQDAVFHTGLRSVCIIASILIFIILFLFMLGQRLSYLITITRGIDKLQENRMDYDIRLEGNDELTQLARRINYLSASQRELSRREQELKEEREAWVRSMSHDIRTPLTSMMSYSELMMKKEDPAPEEIKNYIDLVYSKCQQIRQLTSQLMDKNEGSRERIDDIRLLFEQLAAEWEEILDEHFSCSVQFSGFCSFSGMADIHSLRRIMDNLSSNVQKYADPSAPVCLDLHSSGRQVILVQTNEKTPESSVTGESHRIGLENIRQIAALYGGGVEVADSDNSFRIKITLDIPPCL